MYNIFVRRAIVERNVSGFCGFAVSWATPISMPAAFHGLRTFLSLKANAVSEFNSVEGFAVLVESWRAATV